MTRCIVILFYCGGLKPSSLYLQYMSVYILKTHGLIMLEKEGGRGGVGTKRDRERETESGAEETPNLTH